MVYLKHTGHYSYEENEMPANVESMFYTRQNLGMVLQKRKKHQQSAKH